MGLSALRLAYAYTFQIWWILLYVVAACLARTLCECTAERAIKITK